MASIEIKATQWRMVEVGRVVLFLNGPHQGRLAAIVEIIDHKRVRLFSSTLSPPPSPLSPSTLFPLTQSRLLTSSFNPTGSRRRTRLERKSRCSPPRHLPRQHHPHTHRHSQTSARSWYGCGGKGMEEGRCRGEVGGERLGEEEGADAQEEQLE